MISNEKAETHRTYFAGRRDPARRRRRLPIRRLDRAVSQSCWVSDGPCGTGRELRSAAWPPNLRSVVGFLAEGAQESDGGPPECGDEVCRNPQAREPGMGPVQSYWTEPRGWRSQHEGEGQRGPDPLGQLDADFGAARAWACG